MILLLTLVEVGNHLGKMATTKVNPARTLVQGVLKIIIQNRKLEGKSPKVPISIATPEYRANGKTIKKYETNKTFYSNNFEKK